VRSSLKNALRMRRLGITARGRLGLFPAHGAVGDRVVVVGCCHVPVLVRGVDGDGDGGRFRLMGECYVYGIMNGEAVEGGEAGGMGEVILV
jgi:hypothetical protein